MPKAHVMTYAAAINLALSDSLQRYPEAIFYGEDVAKPGGVWGVTKGLRDKFGERVFDTPISESAMLGAAVGAAMMGMRPIVEIMWIDFSLVGMDQIINQAANVRYVSRGRLTAPLTIRTQQAATPGSCAQHSQNLEALFAHIPGIRVGLPATPSDAYHMLVTAIESEDPTIVIENRSYHHVVKGPVDPSARPERPWGAHVVRTGGHATVVTWGAAVARVLEAASDLDAEGIHLEVIDARWLSPFDDAAVLASVEETGRLAVVHEANVTGGFGAEVLARIAEKGFFNLDAPMIRIGVPDSRIPAGPGLQAALIPQPTVIADRLRQLITQ